MIGRRWFQANCSAARIRHKQTTNQAAYYHTPKPWLALLARLPLLFQYAVFPFLFALPYTESVDHHHHHQRGCWLVSGYTRGHPILVAYRAAEAASGPGLPTRGPGTFSYICPPLHPTHPSINQRRLPLASWTLKPSPNSRASCCIVVSSPTASQHTRATAMGELAAELLYNMAPLALSGGGAEVGSCAPLLAELRQLWGQIGKSQEERERMVHELEAECTRVYRRKVDEATGERALLHQSLAASEAEIAALTAALGAENSTQFKVNKWTVSLNERVSSATALLEELRAMRAERSKQFSDIRSEIEKISAEIAGRSHGQDTSPRAGDGHDLTIRRLGEYRARLSTLQKEKSDRLHKVLEHVTEVHSLCDVLGEDFIAIVNEVHPGLHEADPGKPTSISDTTLTRLSQVVAMLTSEKAKRAAMLREAVVPLVELWDLMDSPAEERRGFQKAAAVLKPAKEEVLLSSGVLSMASIKKTEEEVERLTRLKAGRMKELVLKRRLELENICRSMHVEPDASTVPEKSIALIDSGLVNPSELMASIDDQIAKAKEEHQSRKDIMEKINKWLLACEEEKWLDDHNVDENRFSTGRTARLNLKRAEKARVIIMKIPAIVDNLMSRTLAWESERKKPFLYDGARLVAVLEEHKQARLRQEEERRRLREQKKLRTLFSEKETMPRLKRPSGSGGGGFSRTPEPGSMNRKRVDAGRLTCSAPSMRSSSSGSSCGGGGGGRSSAELDRPRSSAAGAGRCGELLQGARRLSFNYVAVAKAGGGMSSSLASLS
ncbi:65-kDa microtubule-associated protein 6-like [Triticum dicoccoides]|uniref:65-kDa microtubule-associated protein 6-like n=1 Tax=Triticum dicoccoides TaxID=85692 RepID=UPI00188EF859|nr:65-kDa microtubule-associated protein 6-like [Triticum dicoccoides]